jgi:hypothetical protein
MKKKKKKDGLGCRHCKDKPKAKEKGFGLKMWCGILEIGEDHFKKE